MSDQNSDDCVRLQACGPFTWLTGDQHPCVFQVDNSKSHGIYLWTVSINGAHYCYYVGETQRSFRTRLREHLLAYLGGLYRVCDPDIFQTGRRELIWPGMWDRQTELRAAEFLSESLSLMPQIERLLRSMQLWLIPTSVDRRIRCRIEGAIARNLLKGEGIVKDLPHPDIRYQYRGENESPISVDFCNADLFAGITTNFVA